MASKAKKQVSKSQPKTHYYSDLRTLAKRANQRMRELEKRDAQSPAYQAVQAKLEMLGKRASASKGRRFSESGRAPQQHVVECCAAYLCGIDIYL